MREPPEDHGQDSDRREIQSESKARSTTRGEEPARHAGEQQRERVEEAGNAAILPEAVRVHRPAAPGMP